METTPQPQQASTSPAAPVKAAGNIFAAISYLPPFLFLVTTFMKGKTDEFAFWHAKRGAAMLVFGLIIWAIGYVSVMLLGTGIIMNVLYIAFALASLFLAWKAWNNQKNAVPLLDKIAAKIPLEKLIGQSAAAAAPASPASSAAPTPAPSSAPAPTPMPEAAPAPTPAPEPVAPTPATPVVESPAPTPAPVAPTPAPMPEAAPAPMPSAPVTPTPETPAPATPAPAEPAAPTQNPPAQQ